MADWEIEKKLNLGDLLTMIGMFSAMLIFVGTGWLYIHKRIDSNSKRIEVQEVKISAITDEMRRDRAELLVFLQDLKMEIRRLSDKIDRKVDK